MTHWKKLTNPNYLGAYAFQEGEEKVLTITNVAEETVTAPDGNGQTEQCTVAHFDNEKPLILNKTNCKLIEKLTGSPYIEQWAGATLIFGVNKVQAFGDTVDAVRVRPIKPSLCSDCKKPIKGYQSMGHRQLKEYTIKKYGRALCADCATKESAKE